MVDKGAHYLMNKGGVYYFTRHVPNDLQRHYDKPRIVMCLKVRSKIAALKEDDRMYHLLESVGTKPNVIYHTKVRNTTEA